MKPTNIYMEVGQDLATPNNDLIRTDTGKYIYRIDGERFEVDRFNRDFEQYAERRRQVMDKTLNDKLEALNQPDPEPPVYEQPVGQILVDTKDGLFNLLDDLLQFKFSLDTFTKDNRLFFIGLTLVFIALFVLVYSMFVDTPEKVKKPIPINITIVKDQTGGCFNSV